MNSESEHVNEEIVSFPKETIIDLLRDLNVLVVSMDRIGSAWHDRESDEQFSEMFVKFFDDLGFFRKLAYARRLLSEPFSCEVGEDGMDELESQMQDLVYWSEGSKS